MKTKVLRQCAKLWMVVGALAAAGSAWAGSGMVNKSSPYSTQETINRVSVAAKIQGMKVVARINHAQDARAVGKQIRPSEVVIISAPQLDADLMACGQSAGIDMPNKMMAWQDISGDVWLSYGHPEFMVGRHNLSSCEAQVKKLADALESVAVQAIGK